MDVQDLCMGCMEESVGSGKCPRCGWLYGQEADSPLYLPPGTLLQDQFIVGRVLGHGGFGITYLAWDLNLQRRAALKEYMPSGIATRTTGSFTVSSYSGQKDSYELGLQKFLDEARVLARFHSHPGMVAVQYFFQANGTAYLMMEYLEGVTLDAYLKAHGGMIPFKEAMNVMMPIMDALREVHKAGILHRDVSPDNIYITSAGPVKLLDFGAARFALGQHSQNFSIILKEGYAPEEQYRSKGHQGPWTDVYACAATIYRAITGKIPTPALDRAHVDELEAPSALGAQITATQHDALMKALAVDAAARYQSMEDFQAAISGLQPGRHSIVPSEETVPIQEGQDSSTSDNMSEAEPLRRKAVEKQNALTPLIAFTKKMPGGPRVAMLGVAAGITLILVVTAMTHHPRSSVSTAQQTATSAPQQTTRSAPPVNRNPSNLNPTLPTASFAADDTARFFGTWAITFPYNGQTLTLVSVHDSSGYKNYLLVSGGRRPVGDGKFFAADGRYRAVAPKPNDAGTYHFIDNNTVVCTNAAGQTVTWRRYNAALPPVIENGKL
jgi:serine/threonine protein kinase